MKNLRQVIAPILLAVCVAGTAVLVNAGWTDPTCTPPGCNKESLINTSEENQFKTGNFVSSGYTDNSSVEHMGFLASTTNVESAGRVTVGTLGSTVTNQPVHVADFRVVKGSSWFKNPVSIGDQSITENTTPLVSYDLQLQGTTNIGRGDYCTLRANQLEDPISRICPSSGTFGPSFMNWYRIDAKSDGPNTIAARCGKLIPTSNTSPQNLGACYTTPTPQIVSSDKVRTGPGSYTTAPGVGNQTAMCSTKDDYTLTAVFGHNDATPYVYSWRVRDAIGGGSWSSWSTVANSNSASINVSIDKSGLFANGHTEPVRSWEYQVKLTDSLNQTSGYVGTISINSVNRTNNYTDSNGNTVTCP